MYLFFRAFFRADFVKAAWKIPTPYSCRRRGAAILGTICISVVLILFLIFAAPRLGQGLVLALEFIKIPDIA